MGRGWGRLHRAALRMGVDYIGLRSHYAQNCVQRNIVKEIANMIRMRFLAAGKKHILAFLHGAGRGSKGKTFPAAFHAVYILME